MRFVPSGTVRQASISSGTRTRYNVPSRSGSPSLRIAPMLSSARIVSCTLPSEIVFPAAWEYEDRTTALLKFARAHAQKRAPVLGDGMPEEKPVECGVVRRQQRLQVVHDLLNHERQFPGSEAVVSPGSARLHLNFKFPQKLPYSFKSLRSCCTEFYRFSPKQSPPSYIIYCLVFSGAWSAGSTRILAMRRSSISTTVRRRPST